MTEEEWRPVVGYEGLYEVSDQGRVKGSPRQGTLGGLRKLHRAKYGGYWSVSLCRDGSQRTHTVHGLVLAAFVGPRPDGMEVRHLDGDPTNCSLGNLAYGVPSMNAMDRVRHGTHNMATKTHCPQGHPYDETNTYRRPGFTSRACNACRIERQEAKRLASSRAGKQ